MIGKEVLDTINFIINTYDDNDVLSSALQTGYMLKDMGMDSQTVCAGLLKDSLLLNKADGEYITYAYSPLTYSLISDYSYYQSLVSENLESAFDFVENSSRQISLIIAASEIAVLLRIEDAYLKKGEEYWSSGNIDRQKLFIYYSQLDKQLKKILEGEIYNIYNGVFFRIFDAFEGSDRFEKGIFDYYDWSAPVFRNADKLEKSLKDLGLLGSEIASIWTVGLNYEERLSSGQSTCEMVLDEPFIIETVNDKDVKNRFEIDFSDGGLVRIGKNSIKKGLLSGIHGEINASLAEDIFSGCIGDYIEDINIEITEERPLFTGSYGLLLPKSEEYILGINFVLKSGKMLNFSAQEDYMRVQLQEE